MICPKCGAENVNNSSFCNKCGYSFVNTSQPQASGTVTIKRVKSIFGFAVSFGVQIDDQLIGQLANGGELVSNVAYGTHRVKVSLLGSKIEEEITINQNQSKVTLLIKPKMGLLAARPFLVSKTYN